MSTNELQARADCESAPAGGGGGRPYGRKRVESAEKATQARAVSAVNLRRGNFVGEDRSVIGIRLDLAATTLRQWCAPTPRRSTGARLITLGRPAQKPSPQLQQQPAPAQESAAC